MLRLHTSHRPLVLLETFVRNLAAERRASSAFVPVHVVVPNPNVETFLRLGVAERLGIAANLETRFLRGFLVGVAEQAVPEARVADAAVVEGHLLALLHDADVLARPELGRVREYLFAAGAARDAVDLRRCQLAATLARLYDEYAAARPELLAAWRNAAEPAGGEMARWQRALWLAVAGPDGRLARQGRDGVRWSTLGALWEEARPRLALAVAGRRLHVFGLSYIATAYHGMLADLADVSDVVCYSLHPCREEFGGPTPPDGGLPPDEPLPPTLAAWARPGRENLHRLARLSGATVEQDFPPGDHATLLHRLQRDIAHRQPPAAAELDDSLRILPCPSLRRELEVVAAEIWGLLRADATLRACDIAVIVPETSQAAYLAALPAVFHESCDLPYTTTDLPAAGSHRVALAIAQLVDLPFSALTRKALLPLLTHPCLMARFPSATSEAWRALAAPLGIVRGADQSDFLPDYLDRDLFSWDQGLVRLALGAVTDAAAPGPPAAFAFGSELYLPGPAIDDRDEEARLGFGLLARSLLADAAFAAGKPGPRERPLFEWLAFLRGLVRSYVVLDEDDEAGHAVVTRFLAALDAFAGAGLDDSRVSYRAAAELAKRALAGLPATRGHTLASGVTVASFVPMRALPFRAVFVLGLGQDAFPRPPGRDELDLRRDRRLPGDVDRHEQDLYMFLETLLVTRDHLCLSYVCRDEITGEELPASPVLLELRDLLGAAYLDPDRLARLFRDARDARPPLRRYDDSEERRAVLPAAQAEHAAKQRRRAASTAAPPARTSLATPTPAALPATIDIPLSVLKRFLQDPLQGSAGFLLGLHDDDDPDGEVEDEPFDLDKRWLAVLLRESLWDALLAAQGAPTWEDLDRARAQRVLAAVLGGRSPAGLFGAASAARVTQILRDWHPPLAELLGPGVALCRTFRFVPNLEDGDGETAPGPDGVVVRAAPTFAVALPAGLDRPARSITARVVGDTGLWVRTKGGGEHALSFTCRARLEPRQLGSEDLRAFLDYTVLAATSRAPLPGATRALFFTKANQTGSQVRRFAALAADPARDYLRRLCAELLAGARDASGAATFAHPYLLPYEAVVASRRTTRSVAEEIAQRRDDIWGLGAGAGPIRDAGERYRPPPPDEAERMIATRFALLFELDREEGTA